MTTYENPAREAATSAERVFWWGIGCASGAGIALLAALIAACWEVL